jgi:hypothetical protein
MLKAFSTPDDKYPNTCIEQKGWGLSNTGLFSIMPGTYWSGTEKNPETGIVYTFIFNRGDQYSMDKGHGFTNRFIWPVHDGDIGESVPSE